MLRKLSICSCLVDRMQGEINVKITDKSFETMAEFIFLGSALTNENCMREEI